MPVEMVKLELIDDNPFQPRRGYPTKAIEELAASIKEHGLRQKPEARPRDGRFELAYGHLRKRAYVKLAKKDPKAWGSMPLEVLEISDEDMVYFSLEENLRRADIKPMEVARAVENFLTRFADKTEAEVAKKLTMTQGHISNMRRVVRLPAKVLEKVDEDRINFTMARELCIFQGLNAGTERAWSRKEGRYAAVPTDEEWLMAEAIKGIRTEGGAFGEPCTVEGIKRCIDHIAARHFKHLEPGHAYGNEPLFDTRATGCLQCPKMIRTYETKTQARHFCTDPECWDGHQKAHQEQAAVAAKKSMEADIARRVAAAEAERQANISQEISVESGSLLPRIDEVMERLAGAAEESPADILAAIPEDEREAARERIEQFKNDPRPVPCRGCLNAGRCDGTPLGLETVDGVDRFACDDHMAKADAEEVRQKATIEMPEELKALVAEKAGTRAEVLDLRELRLGHYGELKQGYVSLTNRSGGGELRSLFDPEECTERCTRGFHYAFDSEPRPYWSSRDKDEEPKVFSVCTDLKCVGKKKAALTRAKNAAGQAKKKAEASAIKEAVLQTTCLDRPRMELIVKAQVEGHHVSGGYGGRSRPKSWWAQKLGLEARDEYDLKPATLYTALKKLSDEEVARLIVRFMLEQLTYGDEVQTYRIETTEVLKWLGIPLRLEGEKVPADG